MVPPGDVQTGQTLRAACEVVPVQYSTVQYSTVQCREVLPLHRVIVVGAGVASTRHHHGAAVVNTAGRSPAVGQIVLVAWTLLGVHSYNGGLSLMEVLV